MTDNPISRYYEECMRVPTETRTVIAETINTMRDGFKTVDDPEEKVIDFKLFSIHWTKHNYSQIPAKYGDVLLTLNESVRKGTMWADNNGNRFMAQRAGNIVRNVTMELFNYVKPDNLLFVGSVFYES